MKEQSPILPHTNTKPRVLVTGGAGYLGSLVVRELLNRDYPVTILDRLVYGRGSISSLLSCPRLRFVEGDIRRVEDVVKAMHDAQEVIHLGAIVGEPACSLDQQQAIQTNLAATHVIAEVARGLGVDRCLFASTCSVYGAGPGWLHEDSHLNPMGLYAVTKAKCEELLLDLGDEWFSPTVLRIATLYGMSPRPRFDLVVNLLAAMARAEGKVTVYGGEQWRPFLHVADAAKGFVDVLEAPAELVGGAVYNLGANTQNFRIDDVARVIAQVVPNTSIVYCHELADKRDYRVRFDKLERELGFVPQYTLRSGIEEIVGALDTGLVTDYRDPSYSNSKSLGAEARRLLLQLETSIYAYDCIQDWL